MEEQVIDQEYDTLYRAYHKAIAVLDGLRRGRHTYAFHRAIETIRRVNNHQLCITLTKQTLETVEDSEIEIDFDTYTAIIAFKDALNG